VEGDGDFVSRIEADFDFELFVSRSAKTFGGFESALNNRVEGGSDGREIFFGSGEWRRGVWKRGEERGLARIGRRGGLLRMFAGGLLVILF